MKVMITGERITKMETYQEREVPPPPKPPWKISASVFAPRMREVGAAALHLHSITPRLEKCLWCLQSALAGTIR